MGQEGAAVQGVDPRKALFANPVHNLSYTEWFMGYTRSVDLVRLAGDLDQKDVLDVGSGTGQTSAAIATGNPKSITAIDPAGEAVKMLEFLLLGKDSIRKLLMEMHGDEVLKDFDATVEYLETRRAAFQGSSFAKQGTSTLVAASALELPQSIQSRRFDAIISHNAMHWVVADALKRGSKSSLGAVREALYPLSQLLRRGGRLVFSGPADLVEDSHQPDSRGKRMIASAMVRHPLYAHFHRGVAEILQEAGVEYKWSVPGINPKYSTTHVEEAAASLRFSSFEVITREVHFPDGALAAFLAQLPKILGTVKFADGAQKTEFFAQVQERLPIILCEKHKELCEIPVYAQDFIFVLRK